MNERRQRWIESPWWAVAAVAAAVLPIVVAVVRSIADDWYPVGDEAYFSIRARDVLTEHHPLLGTWTSASASAGENLNNPGPLLFDLLALPARLDPHLGILVGAALINLAAIAGILLMARRRLGLPGVVGAAAMIAALAWPLGGQLLVDPWQPHVLLLPFLCFLVLVWGLVDDDATALPWAVGVGSLIVQTHVSYGVLVPALGLLGVGWLVVGRRDDLRSLARPALVAALVGLLCWSQPIAEELGPGTGNLTRIVESRGEDQETIGAELGARLVASMESVVPRWPRDSFRDTFQPVGLGRDGDGVPVLDRVPSSSGAALTYVALAAALAACLWLARRRPHPMVGPLVIVAAATVLAVATSALQPVVFQYVVGPHQLRWLWPLAVFTTFAFVAALTRLRGVAVPVLAGVAVLLGLLTVPAYDAGAGPNVDSWAADPIRDLTAQLADVELEAPVLVDTSGLGPFEPFSTPVMLELQLRGIEYQVEPEPLVRQLGDDREADGTARTRLSFRQASAAVDPELDDDQVAVVTGLDEDERARLDALDRELAATIEDEGLPLDEEGRQAVEDEWLPTVAAFEAGEVDAAAVVASGDLWPVVEGGHLELDDEALARFEEQVDLHQRWVRRTVAIDVTPIEDGG